MAKIDAHKVEVTKTWEPLPDIEEVTTAEEWKKAFDDLETAIEETKKLDQSHKKLLELAKVFRGYMSEGDLKIIEEAERARTYWD